MQFNNKRKLHIADCSTGFGDGELLCIKEESHRIPPGENNQWHGWGNSHHFMGIACWSGLQRRELGSSFLVWTSCGCYLHWRPLSGLHLPPFGSRLSELVQWNARPIAMAVSWRLQRWSQACWSQRPQRPTLWTAAGMAAAFNGLWLQCRGVQSGPSIQMKSCFANKLHRRKPCKFPQTWTVIMIENQGRNIRRVK